MIVLLVGPHGAGKTTLGHALSARLRWPFHEEIGRRLAADPRHRPVGCSAEDPQAAFDLAVLSEEIARDLSHPPEVCAHRIVETWHPGNVTYAAKRSPAIASAMLGYARTAIDWTGVLVLPVTAPEDVLRARSTEPGTHEFFRAVATETLALARALGARVLPAVPMHGWSPEAAAASVAFEVFRRSEGGARELSSTSTQSK